MMKRLALLALPFSLTLAACGDDGDCPGSVDGSSIDGSFCAFADLAFDNVRITFNEPANALDINYRQGNQSKFIVVASDDGIEFGPGRIPGSAIVSVRSIPPGGTAFRSETVDEASSEIVLDEFSGVGARARGEVNLLIIRQNESGGRQLTFDGSFEGTVISFGGS